MTVELTTSWQRISKQQKSFSYDGLSFTFTLRTHAYYEKISNTTARIHYKLELTNDGANSWYGTNKNYYIHLNGQGPTDVQWANTISGYSTYNLWEGFLDLSPNTEYSLHGKFNIPVATSWDISDNVRTPAFYTNPAQPTVTLISKTYDSATFGVSLSSYGNPASASGRYIEAAVLAQNSYGNSYRYTTASNVTSATLTVNNSSSTGSPALTIQGNKQYWYGGYASNTQLSNSIVTGSFYTPCPPPSALSLSSQSYSSYNRVSAVISWARASDGNAQSRWGWYSYSTDGGSSYSSSVKFGNVDASSGTFTVPNLPTSTTITLRMNIATDNGGSGELRYVTFTTLATHTAPNFSNFTYEDTNTSAIHITGNSQTMIQGISDPKITISTADKATGNDGIAVTNYSFSFSGRSDTAAWSSSAAVVKNLGTPQSSGLQTMTVSAVDALSLSKAVNKSITVYPWSAPTITATATRLNNFENDTTIHIVGTWSPVTISGVNKNSMEVKYRYKQSTTTTWGSWITLTASHDTANWTTQSFVLNLDNNYSWNLEAYVGDYFTSKTVSITIPAGQPQFFIGADGRCAVGGKPTVAKTTTTNKGQLEVSGAILGTFGNYDNRSTNENPSYYMNLGKGINNEFKTASTIGSPISSSTNNTYTNLITISPWGDGSGGRPTQISIADGKIATRYGSSDTGWSGWETFTSGIFNLVTIETSTSGETSHNVTLPAQGLYMVVWYQGGSWPTQVILHCATGWQSTSVKIMGSETKVSCKNAYSSQFLPNPILSLTNTTNAGATWHIYRII